MEKSKLKGIWRIASMLFLSCFLALTSFAQQKTLSGTVVGEDGVAIPGVTVVVKGTTIGTVTDMDGKFSFSAPAASKDLSISFVGMKSQEMAIGSQTNFTITLAPEFIGVDEVVVVGYGTRLKEELTGSISTMSKEQMKISPAPSVVSRMQGQIAGVTVTASNTPGADATIRIHGIGTVNDPNPLYVIDGVPVGPNNSVSPNDVESITVLKDASSAAIYGSRGANGVILITTKHGKANQEPSINFTVRTGLAQATNQYDMLNTAEYGQAWWLKAKNKGEAPSSKQYGSGVNPVIPDFVLPGGAKAGDPGTDASKYSYPDGTIYAANKMGTNWYDEIYRSGKIQEYDLSISGGGEKSTYSLSSNYLDQQGFLNNTGFKRYNFRVNADTKFANWLKVGESLQVALIDQSGNFSNNGEGTAISMAYRMQPIVPVYDIQGNFAGTKAPGTGNAQNPVAVLAQSKDNNAKTFRVLGNMFAEANITKNLTFKTLFGFNMDQYNDKTYTLPTYQDAEPNKTPSLAVASNYNILWNWANTLNFNKTFNEIHKLNVVLGTEAVESKYQWMTAGRSQYFSLSPDYMQLTSGESGKVNDGNGSSWALFSQFGRANYDLMGKYFVEATVRRDGSSRFSSTNRFGVFPAVSGGWEISKESFLAGSKSWLDLLKLKAGWGKTGNDRIGNYNQYSTYATNGYTAAYNLGGTTSSAIAGFEPSTSGNPNVSWESTETINFGLNAAMFDRKLTAGLDIWTRNTSDMLYQLPVPQVMGIATPPFINVGKMKNNGFDLDLGYHNTLVGGKLTYALNLTLSHYKNEVVSLSSDVKGSIEGDQLRQVQYTRTSAGQAFPMFYGYISDGIIQTQAEADAAPKWGSYTVPGHYKYRDISGPDGKPDGIITSADRTYIGSPHPDFTTGLNIDLGYANFDLNMFFYASKGNDMVNYVSRWIDYGQFDGGLSKDALYNSWTPTNTSARLPMLDGTSESQQFSSAYIEDASFLRMKVLRLGYTLTPNMLERVKMKNLRIYVEATNLFTITKYKGLDPELDSSGMMMGVDQGAWPTPRQITLGLSIGL